MLIVDKLVSVVRYKTLIQPTLYRKCCKPVRHHRLLSSEPW